METRDKSIDAMAANDATLDTIPAAAPTAAAESSSQLSSDAAKDSDAPESPTQIKEGEAVEAEAGIFDDPVPFDDIVANETGDSAAPIADSDDSSRVIAREEAAANRPTPPASKQEIIETLKAIVENDDNDVPREDITRLKQFFYSFRKTDLEKELADYLAAGNDEASFIPAVSPEEEEFKSLLNTIKDRKAAQVAALEEQRIANLNAKKALIEELTTLSADTDNVNRAFPRVKEIQESFKAIGEVPPTEATDLWKAYQGAVEQFYDQLKINKDLRDYDFRKNLELKTLLCEEAEKLNDEEDVILSFKRLQNLHDEWRQIGPVAKEIRDEIWARFKDASAVINKKYQAFFEERKANEAANEAAKTEICTRMEAIDITAPGSFKAWDALTKDVLEMQQQWNKIGAASRKVNNALFARFRSACDKFFAAKAEYYRSVRDEQNANLTKKTALCEKAEALMDSTDWRNTADTLVGLQKEWKACGAVPKKQSDAIWRRFQKACDTFFENRKKNLSESRSGEQENLKAKRDIIAELKAIPADAPRSEAMAKVKDLQAKWQTIGHVPFREKDAVYDEYRAICDAFYSRSRDGRGALNRFEDVVNGMGSDEAKLRRERDRIVRSYDIKRNELKTYENNLGFLTSKSKSGDSMVREMERRIQRIKDDLAAIEQKIKLIDSKL